MKLSQDDALKKEVQKFIDPVLKKIKCIKLIENWGLGHICNLLNISIGTYRSIMKNKNMPLITYIKFLNFALAYEQEHGEITIERVNRKFDIGNEDE